MPQPKWAVISAIPRKDYSIEIRFADGKHGVYDAAPLLLQDYFKPLNNMGLFLSGKAECGTVVWNDLLDIAPEHLYENTVAHPC